LWHLNWLSWHGIYAIALQSTAKSSDSQSQSRWTRRKSIYGKRDASLGTLGPSKINLMILPFFLNYGAPLQISVSKTMSGFFDIKFCFWIMALTIKLQRFFNDSTLQRSISRIKKNFNNLNNVCRLIGHKNYKNTKVTFYALYSFEKNRFSVFLT